MCVKLLFENTDYLSMQKTGEKINLGFIRQEVHDWLREAGCEKADLDI